MLFEESSIEGWVEIQSVEPLDLEANAHEVSGFVSCVVKREAVVGVLTLRSSEGRVDRVAVTENHLFAAALEGGIRWVPAGRLVPGQKLVSAGADSEVVAWEPHAILEPVYSLQVEGQASYLVGRDDVLVHNQCSDLRNTVERLDDISRRNYSNTSIITHARVEDIHTGRVWEGNVDVGPTLERIEKGIPHAHKNDGANYRNYPDRRTGERGLPEKPAGYYTEYVHPTPGITNGPGPQRIITGKNGELYYTPDHYSTFIPLNPVSPLP